MPFNGSGTFQRNQRWSVDAAGGIKITTAHHDDEDDNLAAGLSNCLTRDGQSPPTANIPMGNKNITGLANPVNPQDAATKNSSEAFANAIRNFNTGISLTGASTGVSPNFTSLAFLGFTEADMSIVARKADPSLTPPLAARIAFNRTANGALASDDLMYIDDNGKLVMLGTTDIWSQVDAAYPQGTIIERVVTSTQTWQVDVTSKGLVYAEVEALGPGGNGGAAGSTSAANVAVGGAGGAGGHGMRVFTKAELGATVVITVASAGSAGTASFACAGTAGTVTVTGGGNGATGVQGAISSNQGAVGGVATGWTLNAPGEGGGASWAGYLASDAVQVRGAGGSSPWGAGGKEVFTSGSSAGTDATGWGSGGGPAGNGHSAASSGVGSGTAGFFRIREFY